MTLYVSAASGGGLSINAKFFSDMKAAAGEYDGALGTLKAALGKKDSQVGTRPYTPSLKGPAHCWPPVCATRAVLCVAFSMVRAAWQAAYDACEGLEAALLAYRTAGTPAAAAPFVSPAHSCAPRLGWPASRTCRACPPAA